MSVNSSSLNLATTLNSLVFQEIHSVWLKDFNIHIDDNNDPATRPLLDLLESMLLNQHVLKATRIGRTFDLVIIRKSDDLIKSQLSPDIMFSDHGGCYSNCEYLDLLLKFNMFGLENFDQLTGIC